tara:strand:- start:624 stop:1049 length:426 start_codon:yes stop_codon:yes gene_type:complete
MLDKKIPLLSICLSCRDGQENTTKERGGKRFSDFFLEKIRQKKIKGLQVRGINCMSQCKRSCIISLTAENSFTYIFGDIKPSKFEYLESLLDLISIYNSSSDGFLRRRERPVLFQSNILGRLPPISSSSSIVSNLYKRQFK